MTGQNKSPPEQTSLFDAFAAAEIDAKTAHLPTTVEAAIPFFRELISKHHAALLLGNTEEAMRLNREAHDLAVRLNNGNPGILANKDSPAYVLERSTAAPDGSVPLFGQTGNFLIQLSNVRVRIEMDGIFGIGSMPYPGFSAHAVDMDRHFFSETGYRSFLGFHFVPEPGLTTDAFVCAVITEHIRRELKGKLLPIESRYKRDAPEPQAP